MTKSKKDLIVRVLEPLAELQNSKKQEDQEKFNRIIGIFEGVMIGSGVHVR